MALEPATEGRPRPDGSARLDATVLIDAGLRLASSGAATISVRALGAELHADPSAIYRHFRGKDDLMRALLDALHVAVLNQLSGEGDWQDRLMELGAVTLDVHVRHPAIAIEATTLTTHGPGEAQTIEYILEALSEAGLTGESLVQHYALLGSFMLSETAAISRTRFHRRDPSARDPRSWLDGALLTDPARQPRATALHSQLLALTDEEIYRLGLRSIIASVERAALQEAH